MRDTDWQQAVSSHREAVRAFIEAAEHLDPSHWLAPRAQGGWSPAQIAEHLRLSYETLRSELRAEGGFKLRTGWLTRRVIRVAILPRIFRTGRLPGKARAPREIRPASVVGDRGKALNQLAQFASEFEEELAAKREAGACLTHHLFGKMDALKSLRFVTIHVTHHRGQLDRG
jgi:uncharacterized damage-inducible protein DinB